nr:DUF3781 domain-containing protein [Pseudoramibacter sp. HA2172]
MPPPGAGQRCSAVIGKRGKNWYVHGDGCMITVNASSYAMITAHRA